MHYFDLLAVVCFPNVTEIRVEDLGIPFRLAQLLQSSLQERIYHLKAFCMDRKRESSLA